MRAQDAPAPADVPLRLTHVRAADRERIAAAAREAVARYTEWFGPLAVGSVAIADRAAAVLDVDRAVIVDVPWWPSPASMDLETQVAFGLAERWWTHVGSETGPFVSAGLSWYLQGRVVERIHDLRYRVDGHSLESDRYFGGAVPWTFRLLRMSRWTTGLAREQYLASGRPPHWPAAARRLPSGVSPRVAQVAMAFATLERHVGWPALQGALRHLADRRADGALTAAAFSAALGTAVGQDLSWFLPRAFEPSAVYDYAVATLDSASDTSCAATPCVRTTVNVVRLGDVFSGRSAAPLGPFESGEAMEIRVAFAGGQAATVRWDGRAATRQFDFVGPASAIDAEIDPGRVLVLDANYLNNRKAAAPQSNVPVAKWVLQWLVWLQDAVLTYSFAL